MLQHLAAKASVGIALAILACSCSSAEPMAFELSHPMMPPEQPFEAVGVAADEGAICADGIWVGDRTENMDGEEITPEQWADIFDSAVASDGVAEAQSLKEFVCADGSGTLTITGHAYLDFALIDATTLGTGQIEWGTFTMTGSGDRDTLNGSGIFHADFDAGRIVYTGEATDG